MDSAALPASAPDGYRSGFVALIGRPNVGKSTLMNQLVGTKLAITSPLAQTTRNRLRGILTTDRAQLVLVDTPGIHKPHHLLGERLVKAARAAASAVNLVLLLMDGSKPAGRGDGFIVELLKGCRVPVLVALNKQDLVKPACAPALQAGYQALIGDCPSFPISATTARGCQALLEAMVGQLPPGPYLYPPDLVSDQPERLLMAELIREQVLHHTHAEIPHSVAVSIEQVLEEKTRTCVLATVLVERNSQKRILIGKGGSMLGTIGRGARLQLQKLIDGKVYLEIFVKVAPHWRRNPVKLAELGYGEEM